MIKLKTEINKSATMCEIHKEAEKMYENCYEKELQIEAHVFGAERLFNLLRLPRVSKRYCLECETELCDTNTNDLCDDCRLQL